MAAVEVIMESPLKINTATLLPGGDVEPGCVIDRQQRQFVLYLVPVLRFVAKPKFSRHRASGL